MALMQQWLKHSESRRSYPAYTAPHRCKLSTPNAKALRKIERAFAFRVQSVWNHLFTTRPYLNLLNEETSECLVSRQYKHRSRSS